jgi:uncharacterized cupin superfamily protein
MPSGFTIINLKQIDDTVGERVPQIEGRFGRSSLDSEHLGVSYWRYQPGHRGKQGHRHREQEEAYIVVGGSGRMLIDGEVHQLSQWDVVRVSPTTVRAFEAGDEGLEFIAVGSDRPEGGDGEAADVDWGD